MFFYSDGDAVTLILRLFVHYCTNLNKGEQFLNIKLSEVGGSPEKSLFYVVNKLKHSFNNFLSRQELAAAGEQFDMVFIDADKDNYINYYNFILDNNLLRMQGVICVDNTLFKAKVYLKDTSDSNGLALRHFNQFVSDDPRVEQVRFLLTCTVLLTDLFFCFNSTTSVMLSRSLFLFVMASVSSAEYP